MSRTLRLAASLASLGSVAGYATELARAANLAEPDAYRLRLALDELFTNIATHGLAGPSPAEVELAGCARDGRVVVEVTDRCQPFDPVHHRPNGTDGAAAAGRLGGFGLVLLRRVADGVDYRRVGAENRTTIVILGHDCSAAGHLLRYERELRIGREIQQGFLPGPLPCPPGWQVAARFRPARVVAGDFYDGFEVVDGRRTAFVVADVCDKGIGAALFMALIRTLLRHTAQHTGAGSALVSDLEQLVRAEDGPPCGPAAAAPDGPPRALPAIGAGPLISAVRGTNDYLTSNHRQQGYFATLFFCVLDPPTGGLTYINGGHNPPVVLRRDGGLEPLEPTGPAVGLIPGSVFDLGHTTLHGGETLFAYTDGVTEARNEHGEFFAERRLLELLRRPAGSAEELLDRVDRAVRGFTGPAEQFDDVTMLALRRSRPAAGESR